MRWGGGLPVHAENEGEEVDADTDETALLRPMAEVPERPRKPITPSLETLEKAVAARIYFENLYFPLLRQQPSREQRRIAMEKDMMNMHLNEAQKELLRSRWRQNETDYLRERRRKVDPSAFSVLKTIGHGAKKLFIPGAPYLQIFSKAHSESCPWLKSDRRESCTL